MEEKTHEYNLTLEGRVRSDSGKLLVIDPCFLDNFYDFRTLNDLDSDFFNQLHKVRMAELSLLDIPKIDDFENIDNVERVLVNYRKKIEKNRKTVEKEKARLSEIPQFIHPYFAQGDGHVIFGNSIGDGNYPLIKNGEVIHIVHNYPCIDGFMPDKSKLNGEFLGVSGVESGNQVVIDPDKVKIQAREIPGEWNDYCIIDCERGDYLLRFTNGNERVSISKAN